MPEALRGSLLLCKFVSRDLGGGGSVQQEVRANTWHGMILQKGVAVDKLTFWLSVWSTLCIYRGAGKSLARPGRKQTRKYVRDARDLNNIETRTVIKFLFPLQGKAPKVIHAIVTETLACFLLGRAKDISAPL